MTWLTILREKPPTVKCVKKYYCPGSNLKNLSYLTVHI